MGLFPSKFKEYDIGRCGWCGGSCYECIDYSGKYHNKNKVCINDIELSFNYLIRNEHWGILECKLSSGDAIDKWERSMGNPKKIVMGGCWTSCTPLMYKLKWDDIPVCFKRGKSDIVVKVPKKRYKDNGTEYWVSVYGWQVFADRIQIDCPNCETDIGLTNALNDVYPRDIDEQGVVTKSEYYCGHCGFGGNLKLEGFKK